MEGLDMATQQYSRRAIASGLSLAALAATPAAAQCVLSGPFPTPVNASPDHELLVLGAQLRRAHDEAEVATNAVSVAQRPVLDRAWELVLETGLDPKSKEANELYCDIWGQLEKAEPQLQDLDHAQDAAWGRYDLIAEQIVALPAQTLAGLCVKALLVQQGWPTCFEPEVKDVDGMNERHLRHLVDELVRLTAAS
jgi:hypothetical protein